MLRVNKSLQGCPFKHCFSDLEAESLLVEGRAQAWGIGESSREPYTGRMAALGNHKQLRTALEGEFSTMRLKGGLPPPRRKGDIFFPPRKTPHPGIPPPTFSQLSYCANLGPTPTQRVFHPFYVFIEVQPYIQWKCTVWFIFTYGSAFPGRASLVAQAVKNLLVM